MTERTRTRARLDTELEYGDIIYLQYVDHVFFKNMQPSDFPKPFVRETVGWLNNETTQAVQIVWERMVSHAEDPNVKQNATGLTVLKGAIIKMRRLG